VNVKADSTYSCHCVLKNQVKSEADIDLFRHPCTLEKCENKQQKTTKHQSQSTKHYCGCSETKCQLSTEIPLKNNFPSLITIFLVLIGLSLVCHLCSCSREARKSSHHAKVAVHGQEFSPPSIQYTCLSSVPNPMPINEFCFHNRQIL
jgi:hypothetical protein